MLSYNYEWYKNNPLLSKHIWELKMKEKIRMVYKYKDEENQRQKMKSMSRGETNKKYHRI